jgi:hypothetical protein
MTYESAATPKLRQIRYYSLNLSMPLVGLPALDADHRQAKCRQAMKERRGHSARLEQNALKGRTYRQGGGDAFARLAS